MKCYSSKDTDEASRRPRTIHIFLGYFFILNYCLGTGFLGIPYSFFYSGYLAAIPTLILTGFLTWLTSAWLLEVMARAQALETFKDNGNFSNHTETKNLTNNSKSANQHPIFEITSTRKFEIVELSEMFVGKWFKYIYLIIIIIYGFLSCWSFASVAGSAWATNIPYDFGDMTICNSHAFHHRILPLGGCLYAYYFSVFLFGVIVTVLSVLDLNEQLIVQVILGLARYIAIGAILIYCVVRLIQSGDACEEFIIHRNMTLGNRTTHHGHTSHFIYTQESHLSFEDIVVKFDPVGWIISIPVFVYAYMIHSGVSSLTHPIKQKKYLPWMLGVNFSTAVLWLLSLGIIVPLWFKAGVQEIVTLDWATFTRPGNSPQLRALSYYLILFPSFDVISAYPLTVHCIVNNIYKIITGSDTSKIPMWKCDWLLRLTLRLAAALLPILAAFGVANLIFVLKYAGLVGFGVCFLFPTVLQLRSTFVCIKQFGSNEGSVNDVEMKLIAEKPTTETGHGALDEDKEQKGDLSEEETEGAQRKERAPLLENGSKFLKSKKRSLYMTPYSNAVLSHPIFVSIMGVIQACLFILAFAGLFVQPHKVSCVRPVA